MLTTAGAQGRGTFMWPQEDDFIRIQEGEVAEVWLQLYSCNPST